MRATQADGQPECQCKAAKGMCVDASVKGVQNIALLANLWRQSLDNLPTSERQDVTHLWATFSNAPHAKRKLILEGILTMCCL